MSRGRASIVIVLLVAAGVAARAVPLAATVDVLDLTGLPYAMDGFRGFDLPPLDDETVRILQADATINRSYAAPAGTAVGLYAAFYAAQRPGVSVHSPLHCLPGTGWEPLEIGTIALPDSAGTARRMVVRKAQERAVVLYWYSIDGRVTGSEIASKLILLAGRARFQPSGSALVRIVVPVTSTIAAADGQALAFARSLMPHWQQLVTAP